MKKFLSFSFLSVFLVSCSSTSVYQYPSLVSCLQEKKAVMFGASWCPHCADQKKMFGRSAKKMPYFECSKGNTQVQECTERGITSYPTWQLNEEALKALPELAQIDLFNGELDKVRASIQAIRKAIPENDAASLKIIDDFSRETEKMVVSDLTPFEKLTLLRSLSVGSDGKSVEKVPVYVQWRLSGTRSLSDIALYTGCMDAYKKDTQSGATE